MIPEASTPSQLFVPWVSLTRLSVAPAEPIPPALDRGVQRERERLRPGPDLRLVGAARHGDGAEVEAAGAGRGEDAAEGDRCAVPEMWRLCAAVTSIVWRSIPVYSGVAAVSVCQSSGVAPTPLARFSFSSPFVTEIVSGSTLRESVIPEASTPSQLFVPCVSLTRLSVAPAEPIPPALTEVSSVSESACAAVPTWAWSAPLVTVTVPRSSDPVPVAVKTPASAIGGGAGDVEALAAVTSIVWRSMPVYSGVAAVRSCQSSVRRADPARAVQLQLTVRDRDRQRVDVQARA